MKHSKRDARPRDSKGFAKGKKPNLRGFRKGPITIEDILEEEKPFDKEDLNVREMSMRTDPTNSDSPTIKRRFRPLDNPTRILEVLQATVIIKAGVAGNNITTGPNQYAYWRQCLAGEALRKFNEFATNIGNETSNNLVLVEQRLVSGFTTKDVLSREARYIRYDMYKPKNRTTRQYVGAVHTLNETMSKMPPLFDATQKLEQKELLDILASKAPQPHKAIMIEHGFDPQTATIQEFVEISERAETKEALENKRKTKYYDDSTSDESRDKKPSRSKKSRSKHETPRERKEFFCKQHGANSTHDSRDCKVLNNAGGRDERPNWKQPDRQKKDYKDHKAKYKNKIRDMNVMQREAKDEKEKWKKANKTLQAKLHGETSAQASSSSEEDMPPLIFKRKKPDPQSNESSSSSSDSDSSSE